MIKFLYEAKTNQYRIVKLYTLFTFETKYTALLNVGEE